MADKTQAGFNLSNGRLVNTHVEWRPMDMSEEAQRERAEIEAKYAKKH
jgi:hypothetical protein